jgi:hypothetical protein
VLAALALDSAANAVGILAADVAVFATVVNVADDARSASPLPVACRLDALAAVLVRAMTLVVVRGANDVTVAGPPLGTTRPRNDGALAVVLIALADAAVDGTAAARTAAAGPLDDVVPLVAVGTFAPAALGVVAGALAGAAAGVPVGAAVVSVACPVGAGAVADGSDVTAIVFGAGSTLGRWAWCRRRCAGGRRRSVAMAMVTRGWLTGGAGTARGPGGVATAVVGAEAWGPAKIWAGPNAAIAVTAVVATAPPTAPTRVRPVAPRRSLVVLTSCADADCTSNQRERNRK